MNKIKELQGANVDIDLVSDNINWNQSKGYGKQLMDFAEKEISKVSDRIVLDASLPAKRIYIKRGYQASGALFLLMC